MNETLASIEACRDTLSMRLLDAMAPEGCWHGRLSGSAVAVAVAVFALDRAQAAQVHDQVAAGLDWLARQVNDDGGWGDTPDSPSNISTSLLVWSVLSIPAANRHGNLAAGAEAYLRLQAGSLEPEALVRTVLAYYGNDRTFSVPILTMCALAGRLGPADQAWPLIPQLPFELALFPRTLFRSLNLSVVSYALPALISMGLARHVHAPARNRLARRYRNWAAPHALALLARIQPENGGFLEATPLTAFVAMSLCAAGHGKHEVTARCCAFLQSSMRADGDWPIDTSLAAWCTTLTVKAFAAGGGLRGRWTPERKQAVSAFLIRAQHTAVHPYTGTAPGGWAWIHLPGGVPDADDTAGALLALAHLGLHDETHAISAGMGIDWLLKLQNHDGGIPTFCRGWGKLAFDRSCPDITAHAMRALAAWHPVMAPELKFRIAMFLERAMAYLSRTQRENGSFIPLWFGNQGEPARENPVYGTALVIRALRDLSDLSLPHAGDILSRAETWLLATQQSDGTWGGAPGLPPSIEETSLAVAALANGPHKGQALRGAHWLAQATVQGALCEPSPIGLYFASLWYAEQHYPRVFCLEALNRVAEASRL